MKTTYYPEQLSSLLCFHRVYFRIAQVSEPLQSTGELGKLPHLKEQEILLPGERGNSSSLWHLGTSESTIRGWRKYCDRIFQAYPLGKHFVDPRMVGTLKLKRTSQN